MSAWKRASLFTMTVALLYCFSALASAQSSAPGDESPYRGQIVDSPELLSGLWEAPDGNGGIIGLHLQLITSIPGTTTSFTGIRQTWEHLEVGVFQSKGSVLQFEDQNYFSDSPRGADVRFENNRLSLHFVPSSPITPSVDLDLMRLNDTWKGRFHRGQFDAKVELRRPGTTVDTWILDSQISRSCIHVPNSTASEFNGWSDNLPTMGYVRFANNIPRPATTDAAYGSLVKIRHLENDKFSIEFGAYNGMCCSHLFVGTLTADDTLLSGSWPAGPNQAPHPGSFRKAPPFSCLETGQTSRGDQPPEPHP